MPNAKLLLTTLIFCISSFLSLAQKGSADSLQLNYQLQISKASDEIRLDGNLSEASWEHAHIASDFWVSFPIDNRKVDPEVQTEVRLTYDDNFLYIGATCHGSTDFIIPTLKRDAREFWAGDVFAVMMDPVNEATNGFMFATNPAGVQMESLISGRTGTRAEVATRRSSGGINSAWDNKWYVETGKGEGYWTVEIAIPFKTLRFDPDKRSWGINFTRGEPRKNQWQTWSPVPVQFLTLDLGYTGALIWDKPPKKVKSNISVIPYTLGSTSQNFEEGEKAKLGGSMGIDAKIAITSKLNLDLTINPDFSQVDVDEQVTNLTTFNIRFPERRLFFLENSDLFENFGISSVRPFFSRRIGLDESGNTIPIQYGVRLSGNLTDDLRVGLMNMNTAKTADFSSQNYTSVALHQRVLKRSVIKGYFHNRQATAGGELSGNDHNRNAGLQFDYFSQDGKKRGFASYGKSFTPGFEGSDYRYNVGAGYDGRKFALYSSMSGVGNNFYSDMGWLPFADHYDAVRDTSIHIGFHHWFVRSSYLHYPKNQDKINSHQFNFTNLLDTDTNWDFLLNKTTATYILSFANTSVINVIYGHDAFELQFPFSFTGDEPLPAGRYLSDYVNLTYRSDVRKYFSWTTGVQAGSFYNGTREQLTLGARYRVQPWGNFGINVVYNNLEFDEPYGNRDLFLIGSKIEINFSRTLYWTTFLQFNTQADNFNINSRLQWRYKPMSDLFLVYTDNYAVEFWGKKNRALVLKLNYWLNL